MNKFLHRIVIFSVVLAVGLSMNSCGGDDADIPDVPGSEEPDPGNPDKPDPEEPEPPVADPIHRELDRQVPESGLYFGDFWDEGYGNYYLELADCECALLASNGQAVPAEEGGYLLSLDLWGDLSVDHTHPVIAEGEYTASEERANHTFTLKNTMAVVNKERVGEQVRVENIPFSEGTVTVRHTADGYDIGGDFKTADGCQYTFHYAGALTLADWSDDEEWKWEIGSDVTLAPTYVTKTISAGETYDNWILRCFDIDKVTSDGLHPNGVGTKFEVSLWTRHGADLAGDYVCGESQTEGQFDAGQRFGMFAAGTHCERVNRDLSISYCIMNGGGLHIERNGDGSYTFDVDMTTADGHAVRGKWTSEVENFQKQPQTTLTENVVFKPIQCSEVHYLGDYYQTGTSNYLVFLADEDEVLGLDLCAPKDDGTVFPTGTFVVAGTYGENTMVSGNIEASATPSCYVRYDLTTGYAVAAAPIAGGTLTVTKSGDVYTFAYELYDDYDRADKEREPHKISGSWSGKLPAIKSEVASPMKCRMDLRR